jgi:hypothetical protein
MKILAIVNDSEESEPIEIIENLKEQSQVEVVRLNDENLSYDELIVKIEQSDKVMSW